MNAARRTGATRTRASHTKLVLLVGGDQSTARECARAACLPVIRARHMQNAENHLRSMHPVAVVVASDMSQEDAAQLTRIADGRVCVLYLDAATDLDADVRRAVGQR